MTPTRPLTFSAALLGLVAAAVATAREVPEAPAPRMVVYYFPTTVGDTMWYLVTTPRKAAFEIHSVTHVTEREGVKLVSMKDQVRVVNVYEVSSVRVLAHRPIGGDPAVGPELPARLVKRHNTSGETVFARGNPEVVIKFGGTERVTVQAGTFEAMRFETWWKDDRGKEPVLWSEMWYGPGVGPVKGRYGDTTVELFDFTPGKAKP
jgi:hypothetical protein